MSERLSNVESRNSSNTEIEKAAAERLSSIEKANEHLGDNEKQVEKARELVRKAEAVQPKHESGTKDEGGHQQRPLLTPSVNYRNTMASLRSRMKPAARQFSRFIHSPIVEKSSETLGKTVFRPSITLGATSTAVILGGFLYIFARLNGFSLSGSEIWIAMLLGAMIGLLCEMIFRSVRRIRGRL